MKRYIKSSVKIPNEEQPDVRVHIAETTRDPATIDAMFHDETPSVRLALLRNPNVPDDIVDKLLNNDYYQASVAADIRTRPEVLRKLVDTNAYDTIERLVAHPNTPPDVLEKLYDKWNTHHYMNGIMHRLAFHRNLPAHMIQEFAKSRNPDFRTHVALNPNIPAELLSELAKDGNPEVRSAVASNKHAPVDLLNQLTQDSDEGTRLCANYTLTCLGLPTVPRSI